MLKPPKIVSLFALSLFMVANLTTAFAKQPMHVSSSAADPIYRPKLDDWLLKNPIPPCDKFSSDSWFLRDTMTGGPGYRLPMVASLVHTYPLIGMNKAAIHTLLGEPASDGVARFNGPNNLEAYPLDSSFCGNVPVDFLDLFYRDGRVEAYRIRQYCIEPFEISTSRLVTKNLKW